MATLSKHGQEVGRISYLIKRKAYFSDRSILVNKGDGWKVWGKIKPDKSPTAVYQKHAAYQKQKLAKRTHFANFQRELHSLVSFKNRWMVYEAISLMPEDPDGCWSELTDSPWRIDLDLDDLVKLCRLYLLALEEQNLMI